MAQDLQATRWLKVFPSDNCLIPYPTALSAGATTSTVSNKLVDNNASFIEEGIVIGMIVYNTTDSTGATIVSIDSPTVLTLNANIMASGEAYKIYAPPSDQGAKLYVDVATDVRIGNRSGDDEVFKDLVGFVPLQCNKVFETNTGSGASIIAVW